MSLSHAVRVCPNNGQHIYTQQQIYVQIQAKNLTECEIRGEENHKRWKTNTPQRATATAATSTDISEITAWNEYGIDGVGSWMLWNIKNEFQEHILNTQFAL